MHCAPWIPTENRPTMLFTLRASHPGSGRSRARNVTEEGSYWLPSVRAGIRSGLPIA